MDNKEEYFNEICHYAYAETGEKLNKEQKEIIKKLLEDEYVQFIYEAGFSNGYDSF